MANYAVIEKGTVINIIVWDGSPQTWAPPSDSIMYLLENGSQVRIGDNYDGKKFTSTRKPWEGG